jgi:hypothetical protein
MTTAITLLLSVVILTLTTLIVIAGIQVMHILHEFRMTLKKLNRVLDNTAILSEASAKPITAVNEFFTEVKSLVSETETDIIESTPDRLISPQKSPKHFFHRAGNPLHPS